MGDLASAKREVVIESPFITSKRMNALLPVFSRMCKRGVRIIVNTRDPEDHDGDYYYQALDAVATMQDMGITVLYTVGHHRKLAIIDREVLYEGSLNILSFSDSCEIMRRMASTQEVEAMIKFIGIHKYLSGK
jgi:phosphatidylserine/phosphatidylglycerophosphate/cardiolipin synthase-like enzyme